MIEVRPVLTATTNVAYSLVFRNMRFIVTFSENTEKECLKRGISPVESYNSTCAAVRAALRSLLLLCVKLFPKV